MNNLNMNISKGKTLGLAVFLGLGYLLGSQAQDEPTTISGFKVPEFDEEGNKTSELTGDLAKMDPRGGDIQIKNLRMEFYKDNEVETVITSPKCTYNQEKGLAYSRSTVNMAREKMVVTGKGFAYSRSNELFKIFSEAKVVIHNVQEHTKGLGEKP